MFVTKVGIIIVEYLQFVTRLEDFNDEPPLISSIKLGVYPLNRAATVREHLVVK